MASIPSFPKLKFCGLTRTEDVDVAIACGVDAIGLNFYPPSPRSVSTELARQLTLIIAKRAMVVGVFVNMSPEDVGQIVLACDLDCVQLHGDETPEWMSQAASVPTLQKISIIKAVAWRGIPEDQEMVNQWRLGVQSRQGNDLQNHPRLLGFLVDSFDPIQRGGTGKTARWDLLYPRPPEFQGVPILLAGGIKPENVAESLRIAKPEGIDVASGIESAPGIKDPNKMRAVAEAFRGHS